MYISWTCTRPTTKNLIIVPSDKWDDDPKVYVLDWINPDDIIKGHDKTIEPEDLNKRLSRARDDLLRRYFT